MSLSHPLLSEEVVLYFLTTLGSIKFQLAKFTFEKENWGVPDRRLSKPEDLPYPTIYRLGRPADRVLLCSSA
jgi:hypothetical protein